MKDLKETTKLKSESDFFCRTPVSWKVKDEKGSCSSGSNHFTSGNARAWPFIHRQAKGRTALVSGDSVNKRAFREENIADLFSGQMIAIQLYLKKKRFYSCATTWQGNIQWHSQRSTSKLQSKCFKRRLGKLKWKYMGGCTTFKISISILFIAFDDMKSPPFEDEIHLAVKYLKLATRNATDVCAGKNHSDV